MSSDLFDVQIKTVGLDLFYGDNQVLKNITFDIGRKKVTAFIGPSGCGKSSYLRCLNRMNDFIPSARITGTIEMEGENILSPETDVIALRRRVGMVFQKPNPFPMSIYENVAYGPRLNGLKDKSILDETVEKSLRGAALWDEVKDKLILMGKIYGVPEKGEAAAAKLDQQVKAVTEKLPKDGKRIVIMHATPSNVTVELENSIAGCVAKMLGFQNVAVGATPIKGKPEKTPYSMEALVEKNPEIIFITFMGDSEEIENRLRADVKSNPAWASLEAVRNNKVYLLPERLFLLNPGLHYPDAVKYMAKTVYPEVFKDDK